MNMINKIEEYKDYVCRDCPHNHACRDLDGDIRDEQVEICMEINKNANRI